jgi:hypothetical protein
VLRKYGPVALVVVAAVAAAAVVLLGGGSDGDPDREAGRDLLAGGEAGAPAPAARMPLTYAEAEEAGTVADHDWGERCDPATGRVRLPSVYAVPCVPVFAGDNGGATGPGVTGEAVTVVRYLPAEGFSASTLAPGAVDESAEDQARTLRQFVDIYASRAELYGRRIELADFAASGHASDVVAAGADAVDIAESLDPFAVLGGPLLDGGVFAEELASRGILCLDCAGAVPPDMWETLEPYVWGSLPTPDQFLATFGAWSAGLSGDGTGGDEAPPAAFAGEGLRDERRRIGVIHFDQDPPLFAVADEDVPAGIELIEGYVFDIATMPQKAVELVARFRTEGITTVVFLGDPIMPGHLMSAATEQGWFPEWVFTGTFLTDTNFFARGYDQAQMAHAFGVSQLAAPTTRDLQDPVRLYRWYHGGTDTLPPARTQYPLLQFAARFVVSGIHMAGPDLTADTFARGLFRIPPAGGGPTTARLSYGNWGLFPATDYAGIDDASEIWWDPAAAGPDEFGLDGTGLWRRAHDGRRFSGEDDAPAPDPFGDPGGTVTVVDELPPEDTPPEYPPPPGFPAAGGEEGPA